MSVVQFLQPQPAKPHLPLFLFLPGMDGTGTLLSTQTEGLSPWFDIRCLAISPEDYTTNWKAIAQQVVQLIEAELAQPALTGANTRSSSLSPQPERRRRLIYMCGESFGGCLAMQVLTSAPYLFERLILVNPASSFRRLPWMQLGPLVTRQLPSMAYRYSSLGLVPFLIEPYRVARSDRKALEAAMSNVPAKTAAWRMELLSQFEVERLPLERMTLPVLLIAGGRDRLLPSQREVKSLQARFPNAKSILLPKSGHACLLEKETDLAKILHQQGFLALDHN